MKRNLSGILACAIIAALSVSPADILAQARRSTGTSTSSETSSQPRRSSATTAPRSSGSVTRTAPQTRRSTGTSTDSPTVRRSTGSDSQTRRSTFDNSSTVRRSTGTPTTGTSTQTRRSTGTSTDSPTVRRSTEPSSSVRRSSGTGSAVRSTSTTYVTGSSATQQVGQDRNSTNVTRRGLGTVTQEMTEPSTASRTNRTVGEILNSDRHDDFRISNHDVHRIPPRERNFMSYDAPGYFYGRNPHYFGYRVEVLPSHYRRVRHYGMDYYVYNDVYYRPFGGHYVVCRPPVGVFVDRAVIDFTFPSVRFSFYTNVYRRYSGFDAYSRYIDRQNRIIARNNATIAAQNSYIAMNLSSAQSSYEIASRLGLAQSYAYANQAYYYDDGVFYIINGNGRYEVIVPPAGALVEELPDDYDTINLGGAEYYRVDDTVYRTVLISGKPHLEVLGQMYGSLARSHNSFYYEY